MKLIKFEELGESDLIQDAIYEGDKNNNPMKDDPICKIFKFKKYKKGIGNQGGFRKTSKEKDGEIVKKTIAFVVIIDSGKQAEWPNKMDEKAGIFTYYGDNRTVGNDIFKTKNLGNEFLYSVFSKAYNGVDERATIPPIFIFKSTGNRCDKKFIGLAVPYIKGKSMEEALVRKTFCVKEGKFENFEANFTILKIEDGIIKREWLEDLKDFDCKVSYNAPKEWDSFIVNGLEENSKDNYEKLEVREEEYCNYNNESERKIKVRVTQGKFRDELLKRDKSCKICGLEIKALLVASHIKPWSIASNYEKQDSDNGILLCSNHDALFDKGYITFDDNGKIIISNKINELDYPKLNINNEIKIDLNEKQKRYMLYHRENIFIK